MKQRGGRLSIQHSPPHDCLECHVARPNPALCRNFLQSARLLADGCESFNANCATGIEPDRERFAEVLDRSLMLATALNPHIGYDKAAETAKKAYREGTTLKQAAVALGCVTAEQFDERVRPEAMVVKAKRE